MSIPFVWAAGANRLDRLTCTPCMSVSLLGPDTPYGSAHCVVAEVPAVDVSARWRWLAYLKTTGGEVARFGLAVRTDAVVAALEPEVLLRREPTRGVPMCGSEQTDVPTRRTIPCIAVAPDRF